MIKVFGIGFKMQLKEPIYVFEDSLIYKFDTYEELSETLEAYDIDHYEAYDSNFINLAMYKKDKYNRVGLKIDKNSKPNREKFERKIREYFKHYEPQKNIDNLSLEDLASDIQSEENLLSNQVSILKKIWLFIKKQVN